jgi:hypothetical protein
MIRGVFGAFVLSLVLGSSAIAQTCSVPNTLTNGTNADATQVMANFNALLNCVNNVAAPGAIRGYLSGLTLSTAGSSANFGVAVGVATSDDTTTSMKLATSYAKTTAAWAVGSGNGSLDTGSIATTPTWYHVFLIERTDTGVVDVLVSLSATTPTLPANYTKQRRIGSMKTDGSGHWIGFTQIGSRFILSASIVDANGLATSTTPAFVAVSVPPGINAYWHGIVLNSPGSAGVRVWVYSPLMNDEAASATEGNLATTSTNNVLAQMDVMTNTAQQVKVVADSTGNTYSLRTLGWEDARGRDL